MIRALTRLTRMAMMTRMAVMTMKGTDMMMVIGMGGVTSTSG